MKKYWKLYLSALLLSCLQLQPAHSVEIVTENFPPYNYREDGEIRGVGTEVVQAVLKELGIEAKTRIYPWARTIAMAKNNKNTLIYSIGRNEKREKQFKWVGVIAPVDFYLFSLKERNDIDLKTLDDAKQYRIGTIREGIREQYLLSQGFEREKNIHSTNEYSQGFEKLELKRIDLWAMPELSAYYIAKKYDHKPSDILKKQFKLEGVTTEGYHMAFGLETPDELVEDFRAALEKVKASGKYDKIIEKYTQ
jgi:polar amino acid transport system substrate-binding protein